MKNKLLLAVGSMALLTACDASKGNEMEWFDHAVKTAGHQLLYMAEQLKNEPDTACFPRSIKEGKYRLEHPTDWTSGFYPGSMWLAYELTGDEALAKEARKYTNRLQDMQYYTGNHDLGFMMFCSYGQGIRLKPEPTDSLILIHSSESLCSRFRPEVGLIRSWDFGDWSYPVIIDNMMNLEMLFWASEQTNNPKYREIAISHANKTLKNHFREDMTSYHVVSYLADSGEVESKGTFQGYADSSAWARGQAWGVYGYTMCYRFTKQQNYLDAAHKIARFIIDHRPSENDYVPYWDYDAPNIPNEPRDASAAAVTASALLELSGFYPGSMWLAYELTGDEALAKEARKYTNRLQDMQYYTGNHDLGFMMFCSYGQGIRLKPEPTDSLILIHSSESLCSRFRPEVGLIRSWDFGDWSYPVIIDNMMNLEMLFWASEQTNNPKYREIAISHANKTLKNHFREDMTSYHVVSYLADSGEVESKGTFQGYADSSAWARGQAWGVYGYTMCYRFTKQQNYLDAAHKIARFIIDHRPSENDYVPYWDYDAPNIPNEPRDASAAAVTASALLELSGYGDKKQGEEYFRYAEHILKQLSSDDYLAQEGENHGFVLLHSVGSFPHDSEIDTPLNYADYYYLEALKRYKDLKEKSENPSY